MPKQFTKRQKELTDVWQTKPNFPFGKLVAEYQFNSKKYYNESPRGAPGIEILSTPSADVSQLDGEEALRYALTMYVIKGAFRGDDLPSEVQSSFEELKTELQNLSRSDDVEVVAQKIDQKLLDL